MAFLFPSVQMRVRGGVLAALAGFFIAWAFPAQAEGSWPDLSRPPEETGGGEHDAAVVVGIERYLVTAPVPGALKNANDWYAYLTRTRAVPAENAALLRDNDGTLDEMRAAARKAAGAAAPGGTLWFVFVGHGASDPKTKDGLLVGVDAQAKVENIVARSLARRDLLTILAQGKQARTVVILDACFSGRTSAGTPLVPGIQPLVHVAGLAALGGPRTIVMTAARADQFAGPLPGAGRPAFSYLALGALRGWADLQSDGRVTVGEVVSYIKRTFSALSAQLASSDQEPELSSGDPGAVLSAGREKGPDLSEMVLAAGPAAPASEVRFGAAGFSTAAPDVKMDSVANTLDRINLAAEKLLEAALDAQESRVDLPGDKQEAWCKLAELGGDNPYAKKARIGCVEWTAYAEAFSPRVRKFDSDFKKLSGYLELKRKSKPQKLAALKAFLDTYVEQARQWPVAFQWATAAAFRARAELGRTGQASLAAAQESAGFKRAVESRVRPSREAVAEAAAAEAGINWVAIPGGSFSMGDYNRHHVSVPAFQMAKTLVTNKQYQACVFAGACDSPDQDCLSDPFEGDDQPVVCIDWNQAREFSAWVGGRLPSEAQWEYAARSAGQDWDYPWGDEKATCARTVIEEGGQGGCGRNSTWPVCSKSEGNTKQGLCDMAGNAWEWVQDWHHGSFDGAPSDGSSWEEPASCCRVGRGGAWNNDASFARSTLRGNDAPNYRSNVISFRPVR